jgi:glycosyltransferase involved in cell wall biosynthesis
MVLAIVVPFLDEERYLPRLLASLDAQSRLPDRLVLVDDGSTDASGVLAERFARERAWATYVRRERDADAGPDRLARASELVAFQWAAAQLEERWDVLAKLDADLELPPCALEELLGHVETQPELGIVGTFLQQEDEPGAGLARIQIGAGHVHGATKFYRRACWDQIAPIPPILGWDTIDLFLAEMHGWGARSFALSCGDPVHLRTRGSHDGQLRGYRRWGECSYAWGEPLPITLLQATRHMRRAPYVIGGFHYVAGWAGAAVRRAPRAGADVRRFARRQQYERIGRRLTGRRRA